jgi:hypothetical protein
MKKYMCWFVHGEPYVLYETMIQRIVESTSNSSSVHGVADDNSNPYRNMVMHVVRMNQGYTRECPIVDKEPNSDMTNFF